MKHLASRFILALSLMAGIAPAMAQAPAPVPALPDAERRTSYSISASTCACNVNFALYGDGTDYASWVEVWVNGVQVTQPSNWTLTSPSGSFANLPRPITDAVLTFTVAQTGTVQIVGARRPRRTSQFSENRGVAARDLNQALTDIVAQNRETWDKINDVSGRVVMAPPGETLTILAVAASRKNLGACFDNLGNLVPCVSVPSSTFAAGAGIKFTGTNPTTISATSTTYVRPQDYGAACDGTTNDATALQNMLTASAGKTIFIPAGTCVTQTTLTMPADTHIRGAGWNSVIKASGLGAHPALSSVNNSDIVIEDLRFQGDDSIASWVSTSIGAIAITQNNSSVAAAKNWRINHVKFTGFNDNYWVYIGAVGSTFGVSGIDIKNNTVISTASDAPTGNNQNFWLAIYSGSAGNGQIVDTTIKDNYLDVNALCFGPALFGNHQRAQITGNIILSPGVTTPTHCQNGLGATNAYGIAVYDNNDDGNPAQYITVANNTITNPVSAGVYWVGGSAFTVAATSAKSLISNNLVIGQSAQDDTTLPRAAIAINAATNIEVVGNFLYNNFGGIAVIGQPVGTVSVIGNTCITPVAAGASTPTCLRELAGGNGSSNTDIRVVRSNYFETSGAGSMTARFQSATGARFNDVSFANNDVVAAIQGVNYGAQFSSGSIVFSGNRFSGAATTNILTVTTHTGSAINIVGNVFDSSKGVTAAALDASSSVINMTANQFTNRASGSVPMFTAVGACGTIEGTNFTNVVLAARVASSSLGTANPSGCTLPYGAFVQNFNTDEAGSAASKYVNQGWRHVSTTPSTTHVEQRMLTGN